MCPKNLIKLRNHFKNNKFLCLISNRGINRSHEVTVGGGIPLSLWKPIALLVASLKNRNAEYLKKMRTSRSKRLLL